jgi:CRISPR-associated protein Csm1
MTEEERKDFLYDLAMGGLLHDVGKVVQRAKGVRKNHMEVGGEWLADLGPPWETYAWAAFYHHTDPRAATALKELQDASKAIGAAIIAHADNLSASEREDVTGKWDKDVPLRNIFDVVRLKDCEGKTSEDTYFPVTPLDDRGLIMPASKKSSSKEFNYGSLEEGLKDTLKGSFGGPTWILRVLERYTSFVPSDTAIGEGRTPDISLYDHLRTTAMIAVCIGDFVMENYPQLLREKDPMECYKALERELKRDNVSPFLMVEGDIRGIQKYIYDISGKKALRSLRARSFYLEAVLESTLSDLLESLGMPMTQVLFVGGGHWILLLPNTKRVNMQLEDFKQSLNRKLYKLEDGKLSLSLAWVPFGWEDLKESKLNYVFKQMALKLAKERCRPMDGLLDEILGNQNDDYFSKSCIICGRRTDDLKSLDLEDEDGSACEQCFSLTKLAKEISDQTNKYLYNEPLSENVVVNILGAPYGVAKNAKDIPKGTTRVFVLRDPHNNLQEEDERFISLPWAGYAWDDEIEKVCDDGCIGTHKVGALRMDVDNLGKIFAEGLPKEKYSLSRIATMSRLLTQFFKVYIPVIVRNPKLRLAKELFEGSQDAHRRLIVVYSGGDDLYVVGAWNEVIEFAVDVVKCFREFTGDNPSVTISGGMVMAGETTPMYMLAEMAGAAEKSAKEHQCGEVKKDSLALFYSGDLDAQGVFDKKFNTRIELDALIHRMKSFLEKAKFKKDEKKVELKVERAFLRKIMALQEMEREGKPLWRAHAAYAAGRSREDKDPIAGEFFSEMESAEKDALRVASVCAEWLDYMIR